MPAFGMVSVVGLWCGHKVKINVTCRTERVRRFAYQV
jgi:hypothetical protein